MPPFRRSGARGDVLRARAHHLHRGRGRRDLVHPGGVEAAVDENITGDDQQLAAALVAGPSVSTDVVDLARAAVDTALADALTTGLAGELSGFRVAVARSVVSQGLAAAVRNAHQAHGAIGTTTHRNRRCVAAGIFRSSARSLA